MTDGELSLTISLGDREADAERLDQATRRLRNEICELAVDSAELARGAHALPGSKGDPVTIGSIIVSLASAGVLTGVVELLKQWVERRRSRTYTIKVKAADRELEWEYCPGETSPKQMSELITSIWGAMNEGQTQTAAAAETPAAPAEE